MKKLIAISLSLALILSAMFTLTASAEDAVTVANTANTGMVARGGRGNQMPAPQMPGNGQSRQPQAPNGGKQLPQAPSAQQPQAPAAPAAPATGTDGTTTTPADGSTTTPTQPAARGTVKGSKAAPGRHGYSVSFDTLLKEGVITQETYDAIMDYIKKTTPTASAISAADSAADTAPAAPEQPAEAAPEAPADGNDVLSGLLKDGVITQAQYDAIVATNTDAVVDANAEGTAN